MAAIKDAFMAYLLEQNTCSPEVLDEAIALTETEGSSLFDVLIEHSFTSERQLLESMAHYLGFPFELIDKATIDYKISYLIPESFARENGVLPLFLIGKSLSVALTNPFHLEILETLEILTGLEIVPIITLKSNIESLVGYCYSYQDKGGDDENAPMSSLYEMGMKLIEDKQGSEDEIFDLAQEAPIAKLVDTIIKLAISEKASDIHIEPEDTVMKVRFRVDGLLRDVMSPPKKLEAAIVSRLKILANLDITETRKPQDGRITFHYKEKDIDFRVSTVRTISGEKMVLRVLDKSGAFVSLEKLGFADHEYKKILSLISCTSGMLIVCGPTGSGKTSTLYSGLSKINTADKNIITIEDPVEYNLDGINQIPVNAKIGMDFSAGLVAIVRQDPDVIMVGEVRDYETASTAVQAALTGHLVFTTLHTRNAAGTITRLVEMGIAPFLLNSAVIGIVGQRLVRTICTNCKKPTTLSHYTGFKQVELIEEIKKLAPKGMTLYKGEGCKFCDDTGYKGRIGIFEVMTPNEEIRNLVVEKSGAEKINAAALRAGMVPMLEDGIHKILAGITTVDEIARVLDI